MNGGDCVIMFCRIRLNGKVYVCAACVLRLISTMVRSHKAPIPMYTAIPQGKQWLRRGLWW